MIYDIIWVFMFEPDSPYGSSYGLHMNSGNSINTKTTIRDRTIYTTRIY